jgi:DnaJ family protein A protein 2
MIVNEGMPIHKRPYDKGNLYIQFNVEFPKQNFFKEPQLKELEKLLPPRRQQQKPAGETEDVTMDKVSERQQRGGQPGAQRRGPTADSDEEDEEGHGGQRVQCAQQ